MSSGFNFAFDPETVIASQDAALEEERQRKQMICKCGHPAMNHTSESDSVVQAGIKASGKFRCFRGRQECPCQKFEPVVMSSKTREFSFKTRGPAERHSLTQGIARAIVAGAKLEWLPGVTCDAPGCEKTPETDALISLALNGHGRESTEPTRDNVLMCEEHRARLREVTADDAS